MFGLSAIHAMNENAVASASRARAESELNRRCSYNQLKTGAVILHSAKLRSTGYLTPRKAKAFLVGWFGTNSDEKRDALVESYF